MASDENGDLLVTLHADGGPLTVNNHEIPAAGECFRVNGLPATGQ
jgi:hypothetical protein